MQGFNMGRYIPPDLEGKTTGNKLHKRRAPGTLGRDGTQTVRFEMPFAVWCHTCNPHAIIGQGVRFNAEKKKVGYYFSTPIWSFRIKHAACGGHLEIRTDPKNTKYEVVEGGKARDYGDSEDQLREGEGGVPILTPEERERRRQDAFAQLEGKVEEKQTRRDNVKRIEELYRSRERDWEDPWSVNKRARDAFRVGRKRRKKEDEAAEEVKERIGTEMELLPETQEDERRAKLISFGEGDDASDAGSKAMFRTPRNASRITKRTKNAKVDRATELRKKLLNNTRAALNPFGSADSTTG